MFLKTSLVSLTSYYCLCSINGFSFSPVCNFTDLGKMQNKSSLFPFNANRITAEWKNNLCWNLRIDAQAMISNKTRCGISFITPELKFCHISQYEQLVKENQKEITPINTAKLSLIIGTYGPASY